MRKKLSFNLVLYTIALAEVCVVKTCRKVYPKVSELAAWNENCKWYGSLLLSAVVSLFCE
jgi:hypothetical protein